MSATSQVTTFSDMYTDLQNRVREQTGITATENQAKRYINIALHDMHIGNGEKFPWADREAILRTRPSYTTGTVSISVGSTALTGASTLWNTADSFSITNARAGGKIKLDGEEVYEVATVVSDTSITLTHAYIGSADLSAATYTYFEDEYALDSDFLRPIDWRNFSGTPTIPLISRTEFRRRYPRNNVIGTPIVATIIDKEPSGSVTVRRRVRFYRPPNTTQMIPYSFVTDKLAVSSAGVEATSLSADTDEPIVPLGYRHAIVYHALANWFRDKSDDARSTEVWQQYVSIMARVLDDQEIGAARPRLAPVVSPYKTRARRPWRGSFQRYSTGTAFDELRDR